MYEFRGVLVLDQKKHLYFPLRLDEYSISEEAKIDKENGGNKCLVWKSKMKFAPKNKKRSYRNSGIVIPANTKELELELTGENFPSALKYSVQDDFYKFLINNPGLIRLGEGKLRGIRLNIGQSGNSSFTVHVDVYNRLFHTEIHISNLRLEFIAVGNTFIGGYSFLVNDYEFDKSNDETVTHLFLERTHSIVKYRKMYKPLKQLMNNSFSLEEYISKVKEAIIRYFNLRVEELSSTLNKEMLSLDNDSTP